MKTALTVAGSDSVGGAGIQADVRAMASVGVHSATVVTAVTAQNTLKVSRIFPIPAEIVKAQLDAVLTDCRIEAVKTGMLYDAEIIGVVTDAFEDRDMPLIVDPVMAATVGDSLCEGDLTAAMRKKLIPACELVTPNRAEAEILSGMKIHDEDDAMLACEVIGKQGSSVLLKGGHMDSKNVIDYLYLSSEFTVLKNPRLDKAGHGSGCTLSALIAAHMAKGDDLVNAVLRSRQAIQRSIAAQYAVGRGEVVVNTLYGGAGDRFGVTDEVESAADRLTEMLPHRFVPQNGFNIAFAKPGASGPEDIAAVEKRITIRNGILTKNGPAKYGAADHLAYVILEVMKKFHDVRCVMDMAASADTLDVMEEVGLTVARLNRKGDRTWAAATKDALTGRKDIPDVLFDAQKNGSSVRILGKDPKDVLSKLESMMN
ncbi:MAG: bifunctional hydroxymethylpyrimidine kinase/phosphomethylpyrimidine kinase [Candidatus Methanoplasma sp.]|jgi:hydroxymethylpyrimidine/phosphomethylpyrimidine kinase|nr:bifunctional hydroxymethylpyrimidine kinase/phosphomethylpyrimidine kinase [Candidatus Methanoplasma sp.]